MAETARVIIGPGDQLLVDIQGHEGDLWLDGIRVERVTRCDQEREAEALFLTEEERQVLSRIARYNLEHLPSMTATARGLLQRLAEGK